MKELDDNKIMISLSSNG